jgi:hypothetical protein
MGVLIPNSRRRVTATVNGRKVSGMESVAILQGGTIDHVTKGRETGARSDGSEYATAHAQVVPGTVVRITGYGKENAETLLNMKPGDPISAYMTPISRFGQGFKLVEFIPEPPATEAAQPAA